MQLNGIFLWKLIYNTTCELYIIYILSREFNQVLRLTLYVLIRYIKNTILVHSLHYIFSMFTNYNKNIIKYNVKFLSYLFSVEYCTKSKSYQKCAQSNGKTVKTEISFSLKICFILLGACKLFHFFFCIVVTSFHNNKNEL